MINEETIIVRSKEILSADIDDEAVILGIRSGKYFGFNEIGTEIWQFIEHPIKVKDIIEEFIERYEGDYSDIRNDILAFLTVLLKKSLIELVDDF